MTNAAQRVKKLLQDLAEDRKRYQTLTTLLEKQRHHIVAHDAVALDEINQEIMPLYQQLSQSGQRRHQLLAQLDINPDSEGMKTLLTRLPASYQPSVTALWQGVQQQAANCQIANDYNGALMNMQQEVLGNLLNSSQPENWLYQEG